MGQGNSQQFHHSSSTTANQASSLAPPTHHHDEPLPVLVAPPPQGGDGWKSMFLTSEEVIRFLSDGLPPSRDYRKQWKLLYSSPKHGKSFNRFCFHATAHGSTLIFIRDRGGAIFGGFADHMWRDKYPKFYGEGSSFVFSLRSSHSDNNKIYRATGLNDHYQWLNQGALTLFNGVGMGGQENFFAWCIDDSFDNGKCRGEPNTTFGCPILSSAADWEVDTVEVWEVKETEHMTYEQEKLLKKKNNNKSVLEDDDNADKVITGFMGHEFSNEEKVPDVKKKDGE